MMSRMEKIRQRIDEALSPVNLEIIDESAAHAGHAGALESGGGHYEAIIVADAFEGKTPLQRHQLVYHALGELMKTDIHALSIKAYTPKEYQS